MPTKRTAPTTLAEGALGMSEGWELMRAKGGRGRAGDRVSPACSQGTEEQNIAGGHTGPGR